MEKQFGLTLRKVSVWADFVELTQRRNLFVHCSGRISDQYIAVCKEHKVVHGGEPKSGDPLGVTAAYFRAAHAIVFEIGAKLAHVLWRKQLPDDRANADNSLSTLIYELVASERYDLAIALGEFATELREFSSEMVRLAMTVNLAQAYKWKGQQDKADSILGKEDWSSRIHLFQIAVAAIRNDFDTALMAMKALGANGGVVANDYRDWPVFKEFRKTQGFLDAFQSIFGLRFQPIEVSPVDALVSHKALGALAEMHGQTTTK